MSKTSSPHSPVAFSSAYCWHKCPNALYRLLLCVYVLFETMGCYASPVHGVSVCVCVLLCAHAVGTSTLNEPVGVVACVCCVSVCERMAHNQYMTWQYRTRATNAWQIAATNCTRTPNRTRVVTSKLVSAMKSISKSMCYGLLWGAF